MVIKKAITTFELVEESSEESNEKSSGEPRDWLQEDAFTI
jgi:hypothetical protein